MSTKRKISTSSTEGLSKIEIKEENAMGNDYLMAKGRLQGVLKQLTEMTESESSSDEAGYHKKRKKRRHGPTSFRHTYVMKLFDRSVDLAKYEEDTPLYPICRAWMANQPRNPQVLIKRRMSSPEPNIWNSNSITDVYRLPPPVGPQMSRIPSPTPEQKIIDKDLNLDYEENPPVPKDTLIRNHLKRWVGIKRKWLTTVAKSEERYSKSKDILETIYNKAEDLIE